MESTRMSQRSIMSRYVLEPVDLFDGTDSFHIARGVTVATLLPLTNMTSAPGYDIWDPSRWSRRRLADPSALASRRARDGLRTRQAHLSRAALLAVCDDGVDGRAGV